MPQSKKEQKRNEGLAQHRKMLKDKEMKRKQRRNLALPASHKKGKK